MDPNLIKNIEKKTGVDMRRVRKLADSINGKDLQDEKTVRDLVKQVGGIAGKRVSKQTEDMIVQMLVNNKGINESTLKKMMK